MYAMFLIYKYTQTTCTSCGRSASMERCSIALDMCKYGVIMAVNRTRKKSRS